jgi:hypothetical protein
MLWRCRGLVCGGLLGVRGGDGKGEWLGIWDVEQGISDVLICIVGDLRFERLDA